MGPKIQQGFLIQMNDLQGFLRVSRCIILIAAIPEGDEFEELGIPGLQNGGMYEGSLSGLAMVHLSDSSFESPVKSLVIC